MFNKSMKNKKAFSIIEVLTAVFVLSIGITAVLALMAGNVKNSINARDGIIASGLAQEGIELVRNIRDNNFISGKTAFESNFPSNSKDNCMIDKDSDDIEHCDNGNGEDRKLYYNESSGFYVHSSSNATSTKFRRRVIVEYDTWPDPTQAVITSMVWWDGNSNSPNSCSTVKKCVYVEDILTDWAN